MQLLRNRLVATARTSIKKNASLGQLYGNMQEAYQQMQTPLIYQQPSQVWSQLILLLIVLFIKLIDFFFPLEATYIFEQIHSDDWFKQNPSYKYLIVKFFFLVQMKLSSSETNYCQIFWAGPERIQRNNHPGSFLYWPHRCTSWWDSIWHREGDWWFIACWSERTACQQLASSHHGWRMCSSHAFPQKDPNFSPLGLLCLYGHWKFAWQPILGKDIAALHCTKQKIQVLVSIL